MYVGSKAGVLCLRYTMLTSTNNKDETAVHCWDPALLVLNRHVGISKRLLHSISLTVYRLSSHFSDLSVVDPTLAAFIVCDAMQFLVPVLYSSITFKSPHHSLFQLPKCHS